MEESPELLLNIEVAYNGPPDEYPVPYEMLCQFDVPAEKDDLCMIAFNAVIDTRSPIGFFKNEFVLNNLSVIKPVF